LKVLPFGFSGKALEKLLKKAGLKVYQLEGVERVIIEGSDERIVLIEPTVLELEIPGQPKAYQIVGAKDVVKEKKEEKVEETVEISDEDVKMVAEQTGCSEERARKALEETKGDIAEAILKLQEEGC
jgi:nascent polypeptide-associated complex subunit alpha